jgi:UDP-N-acetyl-D-glucosamine dehydrogenase
MELLERRGAGVEYHDPHVPVAPMTREHAEFGGRRSTPLDAATLASFDAVLISTDHDEVDYGLIAQHARLVVDTRNAIARRGLAAAAVVKA